MTIEERAKAFANERWPKENFKSNDRYRREHYQKSRDTYIQIATEQKSIDIEEACEWFGNYLMEIGYPDDWMRDSTVQSSGEQRFRKAMEGEKI